METIAIARDALFTPEVIQEAFEQYAESLEDGVNPLKHIIVTPTEDKLIISYSSPQELFVFGFSLGAVCFAIATIDDEEE